jgi:hypothetical protein
MIKNRKLIENFVLSDDLETYDPYDIWKTNFGSRIKQLYYQNKYLGLIPAGTLSLFDLYLNNKQRKFYTKQCYPITVAQAILTLLNLYQKEQKYKYLTYAKKHINWLLENSCQGYHGYCWGMNYDWVYTATETYDKNTPFSTHTPYPLEAMVQYYKVTQDQELLEPIKSVFLFLENDIKIMIENQDKLILSYGIEKDRIVSNANAYSMYMYALLIEFLPEQKAYIESKVKKLYTFLTSIQHQNGSWLYAPYEKHTFIDCFHSVFILKNIIKTNEIVKLEDSQILIQKGYHYLLNNFLNSQKMLFKRFSQADKISLVKFDLYDNAEMLNLVILLDDQEMIKTLDQSIKAYFVKSESEIASMIGPFNLPKNINHLRWATMPYLYALSQLED